MSFSFSPKIVTNGLVLYLDATNKKSYPGSGVDWYDISKNRNDGELVSGPTFSSENGGCIVFDGSNDVVETVYDLLGISVVTFECWIKFNSLPTGGADQFHIAGQWYGLNTSRAICFRVYDNNTVRMLTGNGSGELFSDVDIDALSTGVWYQMVWVYNSGNGEFYLNGVKKGDFSGLHTSTNASTISSTFTVGTDSSGFGPTDGRVSSVKLYSRVLSSNEISRNYNTTRGKFFTGLVKNGLIAHYDAKDKRSHPGNTLRWNDVSGNNYNMTLDTSLIPHNSDTGTFTLEGGGTTYNGSFTTATTCTAVIWMKTTDTQSSFLNGQTNYYLGRYSSGAKEEYGGSGTPDFYMDLVDTPNIYDYAPDGQWHMFEFKNVDFSAWTSLNFSQLGSYYFSDGEVAIISIYDRNLTAAESIQNFTAFKTRFGI